MYFLKKKNNTKNSPVSCRVAPSRVSCVSGVSQSLTVRLLFAFSFGQLNVFSLFSLFVACYEIYLNALNFRGQLPFTDATCWRRRCCRDNGPDSNLYLIRKIPMMPHLVHCLSPSPSALPASLSCQLFFSLFLSASIFLSSSCAFQNKISRKMRKCDKWQVARCISMSYRCFLVVIVVCFNLFLHILLLLLLLLFFLPCNRNFPYELLKHTHTRTKLLNA